MEESRTDGDVGTVRNPYRTFGGSEMQLSGCNNVTDLEETIEDQIIQLNEFEQTTDTSQKKVKEHRVEMRAFKSSFGHVEEERDLMRV